LPKALGAREVKATAEWESSRSPDGCPFCLPRTELGDLMIEVSELSISTLFLERIQTYRGHCVLVFNPRHATRIDELSSAEWSKLSNDIRSAELALIDAFSPDHINVASLGQVVPHLHWHVVPRYVNDPRWGGPIWTTRPEEMQKVYLEQLEYDRLVSTIQVALANGDT
jgi:diadenosine tetraphosphate (Ap4A) HIT family hydrolase